MNKKVAPFFGLPPLKEYRNFLASLGFLLFAVVLNAGTDLFQVNSGQQSHFEYISIKNGLSQVSVHSIAQDHRGFMWFGTRDGLNRYDGYKFVVFRHDAFDSTSLSNNRINCLLEDHHGVLWVGTDGGLNKYDRELERFANPYQMFPSAETLKTVPVYTMLEDASGNLWVGTAVGLIKFNKTRNIAEPIHLIQSGGDTLGSFGVRALFEDRTGLIWIGTTANGLFCYDKTTGKTSSDSGQIPDGSAVHAIYEDSYGRFWIGTQNGLYKFDRQKKELLRVGTNGRKVKSTNETVRAIHESQAHLLWFGTNQGLKIYNPETEQTALFFAQQERTNELRNNDVLSIFEDNSGIVWVGTLGNGIVKYDPQKARFAHYRHTPQNSNSITDNLVYAFSQDKTGGLWIGTNNGLNYLDRATGRFRLFTYAPDQKNVISDNRIRDVFEDSEGLIWIGTYNGLNRYDRKTGRFTVFKHNPDSNSISHNMVINIFEDKDGFLWLATKGGGLNKFDKKKNHFTVYRSKPGQENGLASDDLTTIFQDQSGTLWIGTYGGGLNSFDPKTQNWHRYSVDLNKPNSLSSNFIYSILEDDYGYLWIGTYGSGLNKLDLRTGSIWHYDKSDGLPNDVIYGMLKDGKNNIWLSTNYGLSRMSIDSMSHEVTFKNFDEHDGLQSNEFNFGSYYKNNRGEMFFGGVNGFTVFHPDSIKSKNYVPPIVITDFEILHKRVDIGAGKELKKAVSETREIELEYKDRTITFEFAALDFSNPDKNVYAYKLEGIDEDWVYRDARRRFAHYMNLPGGHYTFRVIGSGSDGVWNKKGVALSVKIHPPFWDTFWFRGLVVLFVGLFIFITYRWRVESLRKQSDKLMEVNQALNTEIKDRINAEEALKASEEKYRTITDNIKAGIYRDIPEGKGKFIEINPAFVAIFGFESKEEVMGLSVNSLYYDKEQRNKFKRKIKRNGFVKDEEVLLKKKDGTPIWCSITTVAIKDNKGKILYYDGLVEDISERKRVRQALEESEEKYRILVERARDGILIIKHGIIFYVNSRLCQLSGYSADELIGSPFLKFVHSEERDLLKKRYEKRMSGDSRDANYEATIIHKDGRKISAEVNAGLIVYDGETADLVFLRDITGRKQLEMQIRQSQKMEAIGHLAGGVAHDFNNILTVINGHGELALLRMQKNHKAFKHVNEIVRSAQRASDLIRQLLAFSRQQIIEPKIIDVNKVIEGLDKMLHRVIGEDIEIVSDLMSNLPPIKADPGQLEQVLMNLIINARDAINDNTGSKNLKQITIATKNVIINTDFLSDEFEAKLGPHILISISDTGTGMDKETLGYIFDPFFTTKEKGKGTGLGLATVFGIVKQNEGSILVNSAPGSGTTFEVYWPYLPEEVMPETELPSVQKSASGSELVLIVEDDGEVRSFTKDALESRGYKVIEASNGLEALHILESRKQVVDLIISDVVMPEMGGQELAEKLKQEYPDLRLILVSGYTDSQIIRDGAREHSVNFVYKPYSIETLLKKVRDVLDA